MCTGTCTIKLTNINYYIPFIIEHEYSAAVFKIKKRVTLCIMYDLVCNVYNDNGVGLVMIMDDFGPVT